MSNLSKTQILQKNQIKIDQFKDNLNKFQNDNKLSSIDSKLKSGGELTEATSVKNNPNISSEKKEEFMEQLNRRMAGISKEHAKFKASKEYEKLPEEYKIKRMPNNKSNNKNSKKVNLKA